MLLLHALYNFLSTVSMVHVEINYCDSLNFRSIGTLQVCCSNSNIVNITESIGLFLVTNVVFEGFAENSSMMAWRSYCTKSVPILSRHELVTGFNDCTTRHFGCLPRLLGDGWVSIIPRKILFFINKLTPSNNSIYISQVMHLQYISHLCWLYHLLQLVIIIINKLFTFCKNSFILVY